MSSFVLTVGGVRYSGWESIRVTRGIEQVAGSYELQVSERFDGLAKPRPITYGDAATIAIDGETVITGYVDVVAPQYDANQHMLNIAGRDKTGDLVDCAAIHKSGTWRNRTLAQIAADIAKPFGIGVIVQTYVGAPIKSLTIEPGETAFETLDRAARYRGVLLASDGLGHLLLTQPGVAGAAAGSLELGKNILRARGHNSLIERFSRYIVKAQQSGSDELYGAAAAGPSGVAIDTAVARYRPTVVIAEDQADSKFCEARAEWQRTVMAARSHRVVYTAAGWKANGKLWRPNTLVPIKDAFLNIAEKRLIAEVVYTLDEEGERAELTCVPRDAYDPAKTPEPNPFGGL